MDTKKRLSILHQLMHALYQKGSWCGETHVQKAAYFLQHLSGEKTFPFVLYKFGPFSFQLRDDLELMRTYGFMMRQVSSRGYGPRLLASPDPKLVSQTGELASSHRKWISFVTGKLGDSDVAELEQLATALFFTKDEPTSGEQERVAKIRGVKPHISEEDALRAVKRVDGLLSEAAALREG